MKTKEVINVLKTLTSLLEQSNVVNVENIFLNKTNIYTQDYLIVNLDTLIKLGSIDKKQWIEFAKNYNIQIEVRPRDASRDVLDKIIKYIEKNPDIRTVISQRAEDVSAMHSPELTSALKILLGKQYG